MTDQPEPVTDEELRDIANVMRRIQVQIKYPAELVERAIRMIVRDELNQQKRKVNRGPNA